MLAVYASEIDAKDPLQGLSVGDQPEPRGREGWTTVTVRAASLNHHDLWSLRGVGLDRDRLPMILGCDAAGLDEERNEVIVHSVISSDSWRGDETFDPRRSLLSELHPGTFAERVAVPVRNLVPKPPELSFEEAACLPTAWLTAYRMLFTRARAVPGQTVLVQGAGGAAQHDQAFESGERLPERVDAVMETVGEATWAHSLRTLKPGGTIVTSGATTGEAPSAELRRIYFMQLSVVGSTMGTRDELKRLAKFCVIKDVRPVLDHTLPLVDARQGFETMLAGDVHGKIVFQA